MEKFWGENVRSTPTFIKNGWIESTESRDLRWKCGCLFTFVGASRGHLCDSTACFTIPADAVGAHLYGACARFVVPGFFYLFIRQVSPPLVDRSSPLLVVYSGFLVVCHAVGGAASRHVDVIAANLSPSSGGQRAGRPGESINPPDYWW